MSAPNSGCDPHRELFSIICMAGGDPDTENLQSDPSGLLPLALSRPHDALLAARAMLAGYPSAYDASFAHQAIAIVLRDRGNLPAAITQLKAGMRLARTSGRLEREADVQATLGITLAWMGRSRQGWLSSTRRSTLRVASSAGRVLMRRALVFRDLGRFHEALQDLSRALSYLRRAGDIIWEARSLTHRAEVFHRARVCPAAPPLTSLAPKSCSPPAVRNSNTPRPVITVR